MSLNKVILIGRLGRDPEVRYMPNGEAVCNFSVATSETWNDRNGQRVERTEWHNITMYRRLAEIAGQYLKKGSQVYLEGRIQSRKYQGKDGIERTAYDIIANEMKMLGAATTTAAAHLTTTAVTTKAATNNKRRNNNTKPPRKTKSLPQPPAAKLPPHRLLQLKTSTTIFPFEFCILEFCKK